MNKSKNNIMFHISTILIQLIFGYRRQKILVADGRMNMLKVLNISKLRGDRRKLRQIWRPHKTTQIKQATIDNRAADHPVTTPPIKL